MRDTERIVTEWVSGARIAMSPPPAQNPYPDLSANGPTVRTVVVETDEWTPLLLSTGVVDRRTALVHRDAKAVPAAGWSTTYTGTFSEPAAEVVFADGFRLRHTPYGLAEFISLDAPTALILLDEHDFSAFLRDCDVAWATGVFANHVTHPLVVMANVAALGASTDRTGPDHRLFVGSDGSVSTSPFGSTLGWAWEDLGTINTGWIAAQRDGPSDAVALRKVLQGIDRLDAIAERSWLPRYFEAAAAIRSIRIEGLDPGRVSGFGGRLAGPSLIGGGSTGLPDPTGLPILVQVGAAVRAVDPATGACVSLSPAEVAAVERLLDRPPETAPGLDGAPERAGVAGLIRTLSSAGLPTVWLEPRNPMAGMSAPPDAQDPT